MLYLAPNIKEVNIYCLASGAYLPSQNEESLKPESCCLKLLFNNQLNTS